MPTGGDAPPVEDTVGVQPTSTKPMDAEATAGTVTLQGWWQGSFSWKQD